MSDTFNHLDIFSPFFEPALMAPVRANATLMNLSTGEGILKIGKPVGGLPLLAMGAVKISRVNEGGHKAAWAIVTFVTEKSNPLAGGKEIKDVLCQTVRRISMTTVLEQKIKSKKPYGNTTGSQPEQGLMGERRLHAHCGDDARKR